MKFSTCVSRLFKVRQSAFNFTWFAFITDPMIHGKQGNSTVEGCPLGQGTHLLVGPLGLGRSGAQMRALVGREALGMETARGEAE